MVPRSRLDTVVDDGVAAGLFPGAVAAVSVSGEVRHRQAYGHAVLHDAPPAAMTAETLFDIASLTKVVGTTAALMALCGSGELRVDDSLARFGPAPHSDITIRMLLRHRAGLWEWQPLYFQTAGGRAAQLVAARLPLRYHVDVGRHYSDLGMILLGGVIEKVTGCRLDRAVSDLVLIPMGMVGTGFGPVARAVAAAEGLGDAIEQRMVATNEPYPVLLENAGFDGWRTGLIRGEVSDGNAFHALGGIGGHAGLFSTVDDLLRFGHGLLDLECPIATTAVVSEFLAPGPDGQALGFWHRDGFRGPAYWHSGFTGTRLLIEPASRLVVVLLTNRLHSRGAHPAYPPDIAPVWEAVLEAAAAFR